ncbi:MAG: chemotaxis protein CheW [Gemmatimonadaceae bacterium]
MTAVTDEQMVLFRLGTDVFAVEISAVERVLRYQSPTPVPDMPDWVEGVFEYQERIVPMVGIRQRFTLEPIPPSAETRILVLSVERELVGVMVDAVVEVVSVARSQVAPPPPIFRGLAAEYLKGVVSHQGKLIIYLDVAKLLSAGERIELQRSAREALTDA